MPEIRAMNENDSLFSEPEPTDEQDKKYIDSRDLQVLNNNADKHRLCQYDTELLNMKIRLIEADKLTLKAKLETLNCKRQLADLHLLQQERKRKKLKESNKKFVQSICEKYDIPKDHQFGYDPDSGELIMSEK
jgi:hypothetical protein